MDLSKLTTQQLEEEIRSRKLNVGQGNYDRFFSTNSCKGLLKKHSLSETGIWVVFGEDTNCDYGGSHSQPILNYYEGKLDQVIHAATSLPGFYSWGAGGNIQKVVPLILCEE